MHFNDFIKVIISELKTMTHGNKEAFFTFYDMEGGKLVSCTKQASMTASGEECCIFMINNIQDDNFEVIMNEGCGELLLEDFQSQPCSEGAAVAVALKIYETLSEMQEKI